jgi:hypothetical protein
MTKAHRGRVFITIGMLALGCGAGSSASALDAYWRGERGQVWEHGFDPVIGTSNWYSHAYGGTPRAEPTGKAVFTRDADGFQVLITQRDTRIGALAIHQNAPRYNFIVMPDGRLQVDGDGLVNASPRAVSITVRETGELAFVRGARLIGADKSANIEVQPRSLLTFNGSANGGDAFVRNNDGTILFADAATAEQMTIDNDGSDGRYGYVSFTEGSTADRAKIINRQYGRVFFESRGALGRGAVTVGEIINRGQLYVTLFSSTQQLIIQNDFVQTAGGMLRLPDPSRTVVVKGAARIAGGLEVAWSPLAPTPPGSYRVLRAQGGLTGKFTLVPDAPKSRLRHTATDVYYVIDP